MTTAKLYRDKFSKLKPGDVLSRSDVGCFFIVSITFDPRKTSAFIKAIGEEGQAFSTCITAGCFLANDCKFLAIDPVDPYELEDTM